LIEFQIVLIPVVPFIWILVQAIMYPGPAYCTDISCPSRDESPVFDEIIIPIAATLYVYNSVISIILLSASGSWMENSIRKKLEAAFSLFFMAISLVLMIAPASYRGYVVPYYRIQPYNFEVTAVSETEAVMNLQYYWNPVLNTESVGPLQVEVRQISENDTVWNYSPLTSVVYLDKKFSQTTKVSSLSVNVTRTVQHLEDNQWYLWLATPSYKASTNSNAYEGSYVKQTTMSISGVEGKRNYIDYRAYKICKWSETSGCLNGVH